MRGPRCGRGLSSRGGLPVDGKPGIENFHPLYKDLARIIGADNAVKLARRLEGLYIYFPKSEMSLMRKERNRKISEEFDGLNCKELAKKYGLSTVSIRKIVKAERKGIINVDSEERE